jgi:hydrogenase large subunit
MAVAITWKRLKWQKEIIKIHTIFGGKNPHPELSGRRRGFSAINMNERQRHQHGAAESGEGSDRGSADDRGRRLYVPDLLAIASFYPEWTTFGGGLGNYMVYGDLPQNGIGDVSKFRFPRGIILNKNVSEVLAARSHRSGSDSGADCALLVHLSGRASRSIASVGWHHRGEVHGPGAPYTELDENGAYSWLKSPRWKGNAMEVGPLARMLVGYASGRTGVQRSRHRCARPPETAADSLVLDARPDGRARTGERSSRCTG